MAEMLLTVLASINKMELNTLTNQMKSGHENHLSNSSKVGRLPGYKKPIEAIKYFTEIKRNLDTGYSIRKTQAILIAKNKKISLSTIAKVKSYLNEIEKNKTKEIEEERISNRYKGENHTWLNWDGDEYPL